MAYDPQLSTVRDKVRFVLGDTEDPPGFSHLTRAGVALLPDLTEAAYDAAIRTFGAQIAAATIATRVVNTLVAKYADGTVSEDLTATIESMKAMADDLRKGLIDVSGVGQTSIAMVKLAEPDTTAFGTL